MHDTERLELVLQFVRGLFFFLYLYWKWHSLMVTVLDIFCAPVFIFLSILAAVYNLNLLQFFIDSSF